MDSASGAEAGGETVTARYWAGARAAVGLPEEQVPVTGGTSVAALRERIVALHPDAARTLGVCSVLVGDRPLGTADPATVLVEPGEVVEFLPPFAGG